MKYLHRVLMPEGILIVYKITNSQTIPIQMIRCIKAFDNTGNYTNSAKKAIAKYKLKRKINGSTWTTAKDYKSFCKSIWLYHELHDNTFLTNSARELAEEVSK